MKRPAQLSKGFVERVQDVGTYGDGRGSFGLSLIVRPRAGGGVRKIFSQRLTLSGLPIRVGLGSFPITTLEEARDQAFNNRRQVRDGVDPRQADRLVPPLFADALERVIESHQDSWKNGQIQADKWRSMFRRHAQPLMRKRVDRISGADLHSMLLPVWKAKRATAKHLVMRVGMVMRWAIAQEYRVDNPASGAVVQALPRGGATVTNLKALPYGDVPGAIKALRETTASRSSKLAMELLILTATRGNEVRMAPWSEIDIESRTWVIPARRMKAGIELRVPLSSGAIAVLEQARELSDGEGFVFPSTRRNTVTAQRTLNRLLKSAGVDCVPHGMRSSFRDWAAECTAFPSEIAEHALAHVEPNKVKAAYLRTDLFDRRVELMQSWSDYLGY